MLNLPSIYMVVENLPSIYCFYLKNVLRHVKLWQKSGVLMEKHNFSKNLLTLCHLGAHCLLIPLE